MMTVVRWFLRLGAFSLVAVTLAVLHIYLPVLTGVQLCVLFVACTVAGGIALVALGASLVIDRAKVETQHKHKRVHKDTVLLCETPHGKDSPLAFSYCPETDKLLCKVCEQSHVCMLEYHHAPSMVSVCRQRKVSGSSGAFTGVSGVPRE